MRKWVILTFSFVNCIYCIFINTYIYVPKCIPMGVRNYLKNVIYCSLSVKLLYSDRNVADSIWTGHILDSVWQSLPDRSRSFDWLLLKGHVGNRFWINGHLQWSVCSENNGCSCQDTLSWWNGEGVVGFIRPTCLWGWSPLKKKKTLHLKASHRLWNFLSTMG